MGTNVITGTAGNDFINAHSDADYVAGQLVLVLGAMPSQGAWPTINVLVNGVVVAANYTIDIDIRTGQTHTLSIPMPAGPVSSVAIQYTNDLVTTVDDRNVYIGSVTLDGTSLSLDSATYVRSDYPTIAGQHDMNWNGTMTWSGAVVQNAAASGAVANNSAIDGSAGTDTVLYQGRESGYSEAFVAGGAFNIGLKGGGGFGTDTLTNVENVLFDDRGSYAYGSGAGASVDTGAGTIDGGAGLDTMMLSGQHSQYTITHTTTGFSVVGNGVNEWVTNVERLKFSDGYVSLDINGDGGMAYRLYQAAFNRHPDIGGLGYQTNALDNGLTIAQVAGNFIASPEFQATYGSVDNTQFITLLYQNVLHRAPDSGGLQFHMDEFASGQSRADMLVHFSESPENQANVIGSIQDGMFYTL